MTHLENKCESIIRKYCFLDESTLLLMPDLLPDLIEELIITIINSTEKQYVTQTKEIVE